MTSQSLTEQFERISQSIQAEFEAFADFKAHIQSAGFSEAQRERLLPFEPEFKKLGKTLKDQAKGADLMAAYIKKKTGEIDGSAATTTRLTDIAEVEQKSAKERIARFREIMKSVEAEVL